jgi:hypothetical protein
VGISTVAGTSGVEVLHAATATASNPIKNKPIFKPFNFFTITLPYIFGHFIFMTLLMPNLYPEHSNTR